MSPLQRQMMLTSYLLTTPGMIPTVIQRGHVVQFTRYYLSYLSMGHRPFEPLDLVSVDFILDCWERTGAR